MRGRPAAFVASNGQRRFGHYTPRAMRILVNATSARLGGGITVLRNLLPALVEVDGGAHEYVVVAHEDAATVMDPRHPRIRFEVARPRESVASRLVWEQLQLPLRTLAERADVVFSPGGLAVFGSPRPQVLMYQNMAPFEPRVVARAPVHEQRRFFLLRELGVLSGRIAKRIVFISRYAQRSILPRIGGRALESRCIYLGRDLSFRPEAAGTAGAQALVDKLGLPARYVLTVSQFYFYKNFLELVDGFARAVPSLPDDIGLVIAGAEHEADYVAAVRERIASHGLGRRVQLVGAVPYEDLPGLYARAQAFVFPSSVENFPNILVEGLSSGVPTFASRLGPMPEIAGDAASYFDPYDPDDIARALVRAVLDDELRRTLRSRALACVGRFAWPSTARELLGVFEEAR
jgi:glycosyltransferase involved in cell wall biosynthesis